MIQRTFLLCCMIASVLLLVLLTGFVPQYEGVSVRRPVSTSIARLEREDFPQPIEHVEGFSVRAAVNTETRTMSLSSPINTQTKTDTTQWLYFLQEGVHLRTMHGMRNVQKTVLSPGTTSNSAQLILLDDVLPNAFLANAALPTAQPEHYGEAMTLDGKPVRWNLQGASPAINNAPSFDPMCDLTRPTLADLEKALTARSFVPRNNEGTLARARRFQELVNAEAKRYGLPATLLFAIIQTESDFRPTLVSSQSAMGLMQLLPSTAGGEVHRYLHGTTAHMTFEDLSQPDLNIRFGVAYVHLLMTRHFGGIQDALSRQYCTLAAYNMGPGRLINFFGPGRETAIANINSLTPEEVYRRLTQVLPIAETRNYVARVTHRQNQYTHLVSQ